MALIQSGTLSYSLGLKNGIEKSGKSAIKTKINPPPQALL